MKITLFGEPIPWARPAQAHKGGKTWRYDSQKNLKEGVRWMMREQWNQALDNPSSEIALEASRIAQASVLSVSLTFLFGMKEKGSQALKNAKSWNLIPHNQKPDWDNLAKFYMDCGNGLLWSDDKIVQSATVFKGFSENPRTIIEIMTKDKFTLDGRSRKILEIFGPDKLKEFIEDAKQFLHMVSPEVDFHASQSQGMDKQQWQTRSALLLDAFAQKHAQALSQVKKLRNKSFPPFPPC